MSNELYAFIKDNIVINTAVFDSPSDELLESFRALWGADLVLSAKDREDFCEVDGEYDPDTNLFWKKKPFPSWVRRDTFWVAPVPRPEDGIYDWDEETLSWVEIIPE